MLRQNGEVSEGGCGETERKLFHQAMQEEMLAWTREMDRSEQWRFLTQSDGRWHRTLNTVSVHLFSSAGRITSSTFSLIWFEVSLRHLGLKSLSRSNQLWSSEKRSREKIQCGNYLCIGRLYFPSQSHLLPIVRLWITGLEPNTLSQCGHSNCLSSPLDGKFHKSTDHIYFDS